MLIKWTPLQSHHASLHLSQSTSPLSASCDCWPASPQLGWCCHMTKAPAVRFHQLLVPEHAAPSQDLPPLLNFYSVGSGPLHIICQSAPLLIISPNNFSTNGNSPWLTSLLIFSPKWQEKICNIQQTTTNFISAFASRGKSCNLTSLTMSLASFHHFYLVQTPKIVSHFYPAFCSLSLM